MKKTKLGITSSKDFDDMLCLMNAQEIAYETLGLVIAVVRKNSTIY